MKNSDTPAPNNAVLHDSPGLEFPDWSGMQRRRSRMTFEEAVHWNDEMLAMFSRGKSPKLKAERRCYAEFIL